MKNIVHHYNQNCHTCKHAKTPRDQYNGLLKSLLIIICLWTDIILDFVTGLLSSNDLNAILMVINQLTKKKHYILCITDKNGITTKATAYLLLNNVWKFHSFFLTLTLD